MSDDRATGKQRDYLAALGVELPPNASSESASRLIDDAKRNLKCPPSRAQLALAHRWQVDLSKAKTGYDAVEMLYEYIHARRWIYSVCRRQAGAKWRYYGESGLNENAVNELAQWFKSNRSFVNEIADRSVGDTATGDAWYRLTDAWCAKNEAYMATAQRVHQSFGTALSAAPRNASRNAPLEKHSGCGAAVCLVAALPIATTLLIIALAR